MPRIRSGTEREGTRANRASTRPRRDAEDQVGGARVPAMQPPDASTRPRRDAEDQDGEVVESRPYPSGFNEASA